MEELEHGERAPHADGRPPRRVLVLMRKAPYGSLYNWEGLQTLLIMGAYQLQGAIQIGVAFVDDGVFAITRAHDPSALGMKALSKTYPALPDFEIDRFYADAESLHERNLTLDDLVIKPEVLSRTQMARLLEEQEAVLPF